MAVLSPYWMLKSDPFLAERTRRQVFIEASLAKQIVQNPHCIIHCESLHENDLRCLAILTGMNVCFHHRNWKPTGRLHFWHTAHRHTNRHDKILHWNGSLILRSSFFFFFLHLWKKAGNSPCLSLFLYTFFPPNSNDCFSTSEEKAHSSPIGCCPMDLIPCSGHGHLWLLALQRGEKKKRPLVSPPIPNVSRCPCAWTLRNSNLVSASHRSNLATLSLLMLA